MAHYRIEPCTWTEFQREIAPLWGHPEPETIPIVNNPYGVIEFPFEEWPHRILHYPYRYYEDNHLVGLTSLYNVSIDTVRVRGIYAVPEHRGRGVGHRMIHRGMAAFFPGFFRLVGFFREENVERFKLHSSMEEVPGVDWLWSSYQQIRIRMLQRNYFDRAEVSIERNLRHIEERLTEWGFGGIQNLNRSFSPREWHEYAWDDAHQYPDVGIDLRN